MKNLDSEYIELVYGGRFSCSADDVSRCVDRDKGSERKDRDTYRWVGSHIGAAALGTATSIACGTGCGLLGGAIGSEIGSLLGGIAYDNPEAFTHPEYESPSYRSFRRKSDR